MNMLRNLFIFCLVASLTACNQDSDTSTSSEGRPIDTWVFRSVLDQKPRMLVAALHKDLYVAYDTPRAGMYKAWKGIVNFQGAVYDGAHGPQPTSVGDAYLLDESEDSSWMYDDGQGPIVPEVHYKGHSIHDGQLALMYRLKAKDHTADITEQVDYSISESGQLMLRRVFDAEQLAPGHRLIWKGNAILVDQSQIITNGETDIKSLGKKSMDQKSFIDYEIHLSIASADPVSLELPLLEATYLDPNIKDGFDVDDDDLPRGAQLIGKNDCKTCHNVSKQTVGPSYMAIARKYAHNDENAQMLLNKIKTGGSGIWGEQVMTPHPEIPDHDLKEMIAYIFSLSAYEGDDGSSDSDLPVMKSLQLDSDQLIPGAMTQVFAIQAGIESLPSELDKRTPIQAGILPNFDNINGGDFKELEDDFALLAKGILYIQEAGEYAFRIWSDDGSKLYLHNQQLIDNDGLHGTEMKQASVSLEAGYHPFRIEFFQGKGGKFLSFNMKAPGDESWRVFPRDMISHRLEDQEYLDALSLPMSVVTKIPGDRMPLEDVHPAFDLYQARPESFQKKIGGLDFLADGRMVVSVWEKEGAVYIIDNHKSGNPEDITYKRIAFGLAEPLGLKVVGDRLFVMQKQEMTELVDLDGDGLIDEYRTLCDDWGVTANFHEFGFGLEEKEGYLYANLATGILPGGAGMPNQHPDRGSCIKVDMNSGEMEIVANGLRTPNGVGLGYNDALFVSDNQGDWLPSSKILHVTEGDWFGSRAVDFEGTADYIEKKPVVWLPQDEIGNSPSTPLWLDKGPYAGQMIHGEVTHGGIKRVFVEEVDGAYQGCVFRFIQGLEAGVNRLRWSEDGVLYTGGIGNPGNWQHTGKKWYGLQRLEYNGESAFEMLAVRAHTDGIEIEFTEALKPGDGWDSSDYEIRQWYYEPTAEYGGPKLDDKALSIRRVNVSEDRRRVFLELEGMQPDHVIYVRLRNHFVSDNEHSLWSTEGWYTMNSIPANKPGFKSENPYDTAHNMLNSAEKAAEWTSLFDGQSLDQWHLFNKGEQAVGKWRISEGTLHFDPEAEGTPGDLVTDAIFEDFELYLEWKISNCGNSGIMYNVQEDTSYCCTYLTGPEMQILDNTCHPDARFVKHKAGDLYDLIETSMVTVNPAGEWNKVRIISQGGHYEFWLNGYKVVDFTMFDDDWSAMVAESKFSDWTDFGKFRSGRIALQDHGDKVWFRNLRIKTL